MVIRGYDQRNKLVITSKAGVNRFFKRQVRYLNLHEYQSKQLMQKYGLAIQKFTVLEDSDLAYNLSHRLEAREYVIKAQVHAGGRGKGRFTSGLESGVHLTSRVQDIPSLLQRMLGYNLITHQTPPEGVPVRKVMIAEALDIKRETYLAITLDRVTGGPVLIASPVGGMDIEHLPANQIHKFPISIENGLTNSEARMIAQDHLGFSGEPKIEAAAQQILKLYKMFLELDATLVEVNPFGETDCGRVVCFDAKINFDDNAEFRQREIFRQADESELDVAEVHAKKFQLNYIRMKGNIGCMVNGAGLAMATMDIIKLHGGEPANFLDVGGGASVEAVREAFKILTHDENVRAILVNIFGGIMKCDIIARGIVMAVKELGDRASGIPLVVRLSGTNEALGRQILAESGLDIMMAEDLDDAAEKAASAAKPQSVTQAKV